MTPEAIAPLISPNTYASALLARTQSPKLLSTYRTEMSKTLGVPYARTSAHDIEHANQQFSPNHEASVFALYTIPKRRGQTWSIETAAHYYTTYLDVLTQLADKTLARFVQPGISPQAIAQLNTRLLLFGVLEDVDALAYAAFLKQLPQLQSSQQARALQKKMMQHIAEGIQNNLPNDKDFELNVVIAQAYQRAQQETATHALQGDALTARAVLDYRGGQHPPQLHQIQAPNQQSLFRHLGRVIAQHQANKVLQSWQPEARNRFKNVPPAVPLNKPVATATAVALKQKPLSGFEDAGVKLVFKLVAMVGDIVQPQQWPAAGPRGFTAAEVRNQCQKQHLDSVVAAGERLLDEAFPPTEIVQ